MHYFSYIIFFLVFYSIFKVSSYFSLVFLLGHDLYKLAVCSCILPGLVLFDLRISKSFFVELAIFNLVFSIFLQDVLNNTGLSFPVLGVFFLIEL